ncbi:hypothetical protein Bca52824_005418 [Brassica carinata]|uniref:Las1-like family protein n=1 Tax=Brassica carinata TaxID=52824 RepID=A0A8X8BGY5_BRACI|nr:hypothetical protein Bca52824_005418 [Brassica carinata]
MESLEGIEADFESYLNNEHDQQRPSSDGCKQVPWLNWEEWDSVRESLFSSSPHRFAFALQRVETWRSRGSIPGPVDVTCSLLEIQLKDGFIERDEQPADALYSEHLLQMLYTMGILRLVNCVIEKTRKRDEVSIAVAARAIGIPRKLIDLRHEGSHRELPSLLVLRDASYEALEWLKSFYWEPQKAQIPLKRDGTASIRREVKTKLRKLSVCFQLKQNPQYDSPLVKEKCKTNPFLYLIRKIVSSLVELYPSFSAEISSVLLEVLLKALDSSKSADLQNQSGQDIRVFLDVWKPVVLEFSNREPELLLTLLKSVLDMIQNNERRRYETVSRRSFSSGWAAPFLFAWLVGLLTVSKHFERNSSLEVKPPSTFLMELIRQCLLLGALGHELVQKSSFVLGDIVGGRVLKEKLKKLSLVDPSKQSTSSTLVTTTPTTLREQEKNLGSAGKRLESVKLQLSKKKGNDETEKANKRWRKAKTWSPCPIGMLPRIIGSSGRLPLLDPHTISKQAHGNNHNVKRGAECNTQQLENSAFKRARKSTEDINSNDSALEIHEEEAEMDIEQTDEITESESEGNLMVEDEEEGIGCLLIGGLWERVKDGEQLKMASLVKILV